jgi:hypothetical protein
MLKLLGPDSRLEVEILGYEFPSAALDGWDSEWLRISGRAQCPQGEWKFVDPCITTFELAALASWLRGIPAGLAGRELSFTEPNIRFVHAEETEGRILFVYLSQEASPPWATEVERFGEGYELRIPFSSIGFSEVAEAVDLQCRKYPERANRDRG